MTAGLGACHARVAVELGAEIPREPRIWPEYTPGYYGLEAVHHTW